MIHIETFTHEPFQVHSYLIWDDQTRDAVLVNCGRNPDPIVAFAEDRDLCLSDVLHTHAFLEFLEGQPDLRDRLEISAHMNPLDEFWMAHLDTQATILNVEKGPPQAFIDQQVLSGDKLRFGAIEVQVLGTPGNSPGGLSYWVPEAGAVFVGDVIYKNRIGAVDIPHGSREHLLRSIEERILSLPEETRIYPGRGPATTVGEEKRSNTLECLRYGECSPALWE